MTTSKSNPTLAANLVPMWGTPVRHTLKTLALTVLAIMTVFIGQFAHATPTSTLLPSGQYLQSGGEISKKVVNQLSLYNATTQQTTPLTLKLIIPRTAHSATVLPDGKILILGGVDQHGFPIASAEIIDLAAQKLQVIDSSDLIARSQHRATLLSDGKVLITGGLSANGQAIGDAELWNPRTQQAEALRANLLNARANHLAQLLADSPVLIEGGQDASGKNVTDRERFDTESQRFLPAGRTSAPDIAAQPAVAEIIPPADGFDVAVDGWVVVRFNKPLKVGTLNNTTVSLLGPNGLVPVNIVPTEGGMLLFVSPHQQLLPSTKFTLFINGATDVLGQVLPFTASSFTTASLPAEGSTIGSVTALSSGISILNNSAQVTNQEAAQNQIAGKATAAAKATDVTEQDEETFTVKPEHRGGHWRTGREMPRAIAKLNNKLLTLKGPLAYEHMTKQYRPKFANKDKNKTATLPGVSGQILRLNDKPLANTRVSIGNSTTQTDAQGYFTLSNVPTGRQELFVDGDKAGGQGKRYGKFVIGVDVDASGAAQVPPIFLPRVRDTDWIPIPSPISEDLVVTHPNVPGMEIHIPKGAVLRERDGKLVRKIALVPIPLDRMPFAFPENAPVYVSVQPGGLVVQGLTPQNSRGIHVVYPNFSNEPAGGAADFWRYDAKDKGWYVYGKGHASADGKRIIPDPGVAVYDTIGFMYTPPPNGPTPPPDAPPPCDDPNKPDPGDPKRADPVSCGSGLFLHNSTDLAVSDVAAVSVTRSYRQNDTVQRAFGNGTAHQYGSYLYFPTAGNYATTVSLVDSVGSQAIFTRTSPGTDAASAVFEVLTHPGVYFKSKITFDSTTSRWILSNKDGSIQEFTNTAGLPLVAMRDRNGNAITITRAGGFIQRLSTPGGRYIDFTYDASNRVSTLEDNAGNLVSYQYNTAGYLAKAIYPDTTFETYTYDTAGRMLTVTDRRGNIMATNQYDANGRVAKQILNDGAVFQFNYTTDTGGKIIQTDVTDPRGIVERFTYNQSNLLVSSVQALGQPEQVTTTFERDPTSNLMLSKTDNAGRKTAYTYDSQGNVTSMTQRLGTPQAVTESYTYEPSYNQIATRTDALGRTTTYSYDSAGNLTQVTNPLGEKVKLAYNPAGQVSQITDPLGNINQLVYDGTDLTNTIDALGRSTGRFVDTLGRVAVVTDPLGNKSRVDYDSISRVTKQTNALGGVISYAYDGNNNLLNLTDPNNNLTQYTYDGRNRLLSTKDPLLKVSSNAYDLNGNLTQATDRKGQVTSVTYDGLNRPVKITYADLSTVTNTYDAGNRLTQIVDSVSGTITRSYDGLDRLTQEVSSKGTVNYTYDAAGRRTSMTVQGQTAVNYSYDNADRLTQVSQGTNTVSFTYDAAGRTATKTLPNGVVATYTYDAASQLSKITYTKGMLFIGDLTYDYDAAGRRVQMGGSLARANLPSAMTGTYNAANRLTQFNSRILSYDANGNMLDDGLKTYNWDARDQLASLGGGASFSYDASGRRLSKTIGSVQTGFLYDGINPVRELNADNSTKADLLTGGVDEFFSRTANGVTSSFITDALGSTLALTDATGNLTTQYSYEAYGNTTQSGASSDNPFQYTGRENDGTGLMYYRARYYSPELSRFISEDPLGFEGGVNLYAYVHADPVSKTDPLGLAPKYCGSCSPGDTNCLLRGGNLCDPGVDPITEICCDDQKLSQCVDPGLGLDFGACVASRNPTSPPCVNFLGGAGSSAVCIYNACKRVPKGTCNKSCPVK